MKLNWKSDTERYCWENLIVGALLGIVSLFGDFVIKIFNHVHPIHFGAFQILGVLASVVIIWRAIYYLTYYGE